MIYIITSLVKDCRKGICETRKKILYIFKSGDFKNNAEIEKKAYLLENTTVGNRVSLVSFAFFLCI
jgi:hypothetical protein